MEQNNVPFLVVGGTTKAATSSIFAWLQDHPQVKKTTVKEFRFFMDTKYPLRFMDTYQSTEESLAEYLKNFRANNSQQVLHVDVTPDYLYGASTPQQLYEALPNAQIVFILRNPLSRVKSWYRFAYQDGLLNGISFDQYLATQELEEKHDAGIPQWQRAQEQGRYAYYIQKFLEYFPKPQVHVLFFEELKNDPAKALKEIANVSGIDPSFYDEYEFPVVNETQNLKNPGLHGLYKKATFAIRKATYKSKTLSALRVGARKLIEPLYRKLNPETSKETGIGDYDFTPSQRKDLINYYREDILILREILGDQVLPWSEWN